MGSDDLDVIAAHVAEQLGLRGGGAFRPHRDWADLGRLVETMESRGCYLLLNTADVGRIRRMASFHASRDGGFPLLGSSGWGEFATIGEAVVVAAARALPA